MVESLMVESLIALGQGRSHRVDGVGRFRELGLLDRPDRLPISYPSVTHRLPIDAWHPTGGLPADDSPPPEG